MGGTDGDNGGGGVSGAKGGHQGTFFHSKTVLKPSRPCAVPQGRASTAASFVLAQGLRSAFSEDVFLGLQTPTVQHNACRDWIGLN